MLGRRQRRDLAGHTQFEGGRIRFVAEGDIRRLPTPNVHDVLGGGAGLESSRDAGHLHRLVRQTRSIDTDPSQEAAEVHCRRRGTERAVKDWNERGLMAAKLEIDKGTISSSRTKAKAEAAKEKRRHADRTIRGVRRRKTGLAALM